MTCGDRRRGHSEVHPIYARLAQAALSDRVIDGICAAEFVPSSLNSPSGSGACYAVERRFGCAEDQFENVRSREKTSRPQIS